MTRPMDEARRRRNLVALLVGATAVVTFGGPHLLRGPTYVDRVSVVNRSEYDVHVDVRGGDGGGWMSLTTADGGATTAAQDVIDQGASWVFRFRSQGRQGGELRLGRTDLVQAGWTIEMPEAVLERLRQQGAPPTP